MADSSVISQWSGKMDSTNHLTEFIEKQGEFLQQIALLIWLHKGEQYEALYDAVTGVKTWVEMMKHFENGEGFEALKIGLLGWLHTGFGAQGVIQQSLTSTNVAQELTRWLTKEDEVEALRNQTLLNIASFVQQNPTASDDIVRNEVCHQIELFAVGLQTVAF